MRKHLALFGVLAVFGGCNETDTRAGTDPAVGAAVARTRAAHPELFRRKIALLGFDSCDPDLVEQYVREGKLPHFARLLREGAHGALQTIQPMLSPVVWTSIATGMTPQRHGILDFFRNTPAGLVPFSSKQRQADTVWELLSSQGEKVGVVGWLCTWPAEKVNGFMVTERVGQLAFEFGTQNVDTSSQRTWPESLAADIADERVDPATLPLSNIRPFLDITEAEYRAAYLPDFDPRNAVGNLRLTLATAETFRNVGERLHAEEKPRFFACYFEAMDAISHLFMPYAPPKTRHVPADLYLKYRTAVEANYIWHDRVLGEFMDQCDADTTLIVVSDHGFKNGDYRLEGGSGFQDKTGAMWHRNYGVFYAWGNGVIPGATVAGAHVYDIAPTILASMGYPVPDEMRGKVLVDAFEGGIPFETVPTYRGEARRDEMAKLMAEEGEPQARSPEEEDAMKRLDSLGYLGAGGGAGGGGRGSDPVTTKLNHGIAYLGQGRPEQAYKVFKELLDERRRIPTEDWAMVSVLDAIASACLRTRRLDEAETYIAESLEKDPQGAQAMVLRTHSLMARRKYDDAVKSAQATLDFKNDTPMYYGVLAMALQGQFDEAEKRDDAAEKSRLHQAIIEAHEAALRLEPRQVESLFELARTRLSRPNDVSVFETARAELDRVLEMNPEHITALNNRAMALLNLGRNAKRAGRAEDADRDLRAALASAEKAVSLASTRYGPDYPGYARGWANKAYVLWALGRMDDAAAAASKARSIDPAYVLNDAFVNALAAAGHPIAPAAPK